jgi:hypothetical protein
MVLQAQDQPSAEGARDAPDVRRVGYVTQMEVSRRTRREPGYRSRGQAPGETLQIERDHG